jgi:hypothetical protein
MPGPYHACTWKPRVFIDNLSAFAEDIADLRKNVCDATKQGRREMVTSAFVEMALIAFLGGSLRYLLPDLDIDELRPKINRLVLAVFLPALNFRVIYDAELGEVLRRARPST